MKYVSEKEVKEAIDELSRDVFDMGTENPLIATLITYLRAHEDEIYCDINNDWSSMDDS